MTEFPLEPSQATSWLAERRWFGDKSRTIIHVEPRNLATLHIGGHDVELTVVTITFEDGGKADYFIPLRAATGPDLVEALSDREFQTWLGEGFRDRRELTMDDESLLTWHPSSAVNGPWWNQSPKPLEGEQSNTSIRFGRDAVIKVFRKWQPGVNPDTEIVEFLTEETSFEHVPTYLGSIRLTRDDSAIEVAAVQNFVPNDGDAWKWLPPALASLESGHEDALLASIRLLGQRTGELHVALALGHDDAFAAESIAAADVSETLKRIENELSATIGTLQSSGHVDQAQAQALHQGLANRLSETSSLIGTQRIRVHGDYHLGQVLRSGDDFVIIDFEGEPSRSMAERRQKHSPLKDVAGMLRSLDYAVASAATEADPAQGDRLRAFGRRLDVAFRDGYRAAILAGPDNLLPTNDEGFTAALDVYMIEKALYETRYELDNRPNWIDIPLGALKRIAGLE